MRTSLYSILCIVIRLGAVVLAVSTLASALSVALMIRQGTSPMDLWPVIVLFTAVLAIAFLLWLYPGPLARLCSARSAQQVFESPIAVRDLQWVALSVLGMYFVVEGLVGFARYEVSLFVADAVIDRERRIEDFVRTGLYWLIQIVLGAALTLGARGLTGLLHRIRYGNPDHRAEAAREQ